MANEPSARPIHLLREHVIALETALGLVLVRPKQEPVHRLRTSARRIEAQLTLLSLIPGLPEHTKPARAVRKLLKKVRQAAGGVRDLDVQRKLLKEQQMECHAPKKLRNEASDLRRTLKRRRSRESAHLLKVLKAGRHKLLSAVEHLFKALAPAEHLKLSPTRLSQLALGWYQRTTAANQIDADPDTLHTIRKSAKLARYIADAGSGKLASTFQALQQTGGTWHDLLTLAHIAEKQSGLHSPLTRIFLHNRDTALEVYRQALLKQPSEV